MKLSCDAIKSLADLTIADAIDVEAPPNAFPNGLNCLDIKLCGAGECKLSRCNKVEST